MLVLLCLLASRFNGCNESRTFYFFCCTLIQPTSRFCLVGIEAVILQSSAAPLSVRRERQWAKIRPRMQVWRHAILVAESENIEFLPARGCCLFDDGLHLCCVCVRARVCVCCISAPQEGDAYVCAYMCMCAASRRHTKMPTACVSACMCACVCVLHLSTTKKGASSKKSCLLHLHVRAGVRECVCMLVLHLGFTQKVPTGVCMCMCMRMCACAVHSQCYQVRSDVCGCVRSALFCKNDLMRD